jgi:hypothetical protein|tara:strand:+ start:320 stop:454 length:135 start_codon:yes stop_codon:yes gene_type:complete
MSETDTLVLLLGVGIFEGSEIRDAVNIPLELLKEGVILDGIAED